MTSSLGLNDYVIINDINYETLPDHFTPGIGGTYKQTPPPYKEPKPVTAQWNAQEPSPGCENTITAGWRTASYCTPKTVTCDLERPLEPQRHIDPGRLDYLMCEVAAKKALMKTKKDNFIYILIGVALLATLFSWYSKRKN